MAMPEKFSLIQFVTFLEEPIPSQAGDALEPDTFKALVVQDFDRTAVEDWNDFSSNVRSEETRN